MRRIRRISLLTLVLASAIATVLAGGAAASPQKCVIQLRVNVFGTSPGANWALQGGLNAGQLATLRAVARGCTIDHIRGRWISGRTGALTPKQCGGGITCVWKVPANRQSAAAFQAFATSSGSAARSNVVRVAWAGSCTRIGTWVNDIPGLGLTTTWTIETGGVAREAGGGAATGIATLTGHVLRITWTGADQVTTGVYEWTLGPNCQKGSGTLRITAPASRVGESHRTTVDRQPAG
jgi:hypothetical protein